MTGPLQRSALGDLTRLASGGQGYVYDAPGIRFNNGSSELVFKEYKPQFRSKIDAGALAAMPEFLRTLRPVETQLLLAIAAWNCGIVVDGGAVIGFVMPKFPERFRIKVTPGGRPAVWDAELQHLLNHPDILYGFGHVVTLRQRLALIRSVAGNLTFLHKIGVVVGDISPKNLLFAFDGNNAYSYFLDTDGMVVNGRSILPPVETPGWSVPAGEQPSTVRSDAYKLGLIALRLLAADQHPQTPASIPPFTPPLLRQLITDTLTAPPAARPTPAAWCNVLDTLL